MHAMVPLSFLVRWPGCHGTYLGIRSKRCIRPQRNHDKSKKRSDRVPWASALVFLVLCFPLLPKAGSLFVYSVSRHCLVQSKTYFLMNHKTIERKEGSHGLLQQDDLFLLGGTAGPTSASIRRSLSDGLHEIAHVTFFRLAAGSLSGH